MKTPAVLGAVLHLGQCFDLLDAEYTDVLAEAYPQFKQEVLEFWGDPLPKNRPLHANDDDILLRDLDCAVVNWTIEELQRKGTPFHSVRGVFQEGKAAFPDSGSALIFKSPFVIPLVYWAISYHLPNVMMLNSQPFFDVRAAWKRVVLERDSMTKEERLATLVDAGILTPKGNPRKPYISDCLLMTSVTK